MLQFNEAAQKRLAVLTSENFITENRSRDRKRKSEITFLEEALRNREGKSDLYYIILHGIQYKFEVFFHNFWNSPDLKEDITAIRELLLGSMTLRSLMDKEVAKVKSADFCLLFLLTMECPAAWEDVKNIMDIFRGDDAVGAEGFQELWKKIKRVCSESGAHRYTVYALFMEL